MKLFFVLFIYVFSPSTLAAQWSAHDAKLTMDERYEIGEGDPYIEYKLDEPVGGKGGVTFELHLEQRDTPFTMEVFYSTNFHEYNPFYRYRFRLAALDRQLIHLPISLGPLENIHRLRFDFEQCSNCIVRISDVKIHREDNETLHKFIPEYTPLPVMNHLEAGGHEMRLENWTGNNMIVGKYGELKITGKEPYISSESMNLPAEELGAVVFELRVPERQRTYTFKLYYESYGQTSSGQAHIYLRVFSEHDILRIAIPLDVIPAGDVMKRLRLSFERCEACDWRLLSARLTPPEAADEMLADVPNQIVRFGSKAAPLPILMKKILFRFGQDPWFFAFYILVLLGVVACSIYRYFQRGCRRA